MAAEVLSTGAGDRGSFDRFREAIAATHEPWDMPRPRAAQFRSKLRHRSLGVTEVIGCRTDACRGRRGRPELGRSEGERVGVLFVLAGQEHLEREGDKTTLTAGQLTLWSSARPLRFLVPDRLRKLTWMLPAGLVESPGGRGTEALTAIYDARQGPGAMIRAQLEELLVMPGALDAKGERAVLDGMLGLLDALRRSGAPAPRGLLARAEALVRRSLDDPGFCVEDAARALGVSRRHLDRVFATRGQSAVRFLWSERLERCRRDLLREPRAHVSEIAFRWGFSDAGHFSRAFRRAYGTTPTAWRRRHRS